MDTPHGHLQFAFACTEAQTAHAYACEQTLSFDDAIQDLESLGVVLNQDQIGKRLVCLFFFLTFVL
jgi:hypothetical protein